MKIRNLFIGAVAAVFALVGCQETEQNLGTPDISISPNELNFEIASGKQTIKVNATRDWKVETDADWVVVEPEKGEASAEDQTVTVTVLENTGLDREADLKFTIGMKSKHLTVLQAGPGGSAEALIVYYNDYDKVEAEKTYGSGSSWPFLDQFEGWKNATGTGSANVAYSFKGMSARANSTSDSDYSDYPGSGKNNMFFGSSAYFATKNIALGGATGFTLTFGTEKYSQDNGKVFTNSEFHIFLSKDGAKWVELTDYIFAGGTTEGRWNIATANFSVPEGTENLSICMQVDVASSYRMDDLKLVISAGGTEVDFSKGVDKDFGADSGNNPGTGDLPDGTGEGTKASPYDAAKATKVASALADGETKAGVYVKGIVKSFKDVSGIAQYGNISYYITDADGAANFYVFRGKYLDNAKFTSEDQLKIGDEVVVYGDLVNYMGNTPELEQGNYLVSINGGDNPGGDNPGGGEDVEVTKPESLVKVTIEEFLAAEEDDTWYELTGEIVSIVSGNKYGNFTIKDETGSVYIYGMTSQWVGSNDQSFNSLGLKVTDIVTLGTLRTSNPNNGVAQGGGSKIPAYYISHVPGAGVPEDPEGTIELTFSSSTQESVGSYTSEWSATIGSNSWKIVNFNNNSNKWSYIKCGHKSTANVSTITTKNAYAASIKKVVVSVDQLIDASKVTAKLEVATDAEFASVVETVDITLAVGEVICNISAPQENCYYRLTFDNKALGGNTNGNVQISKVKYVPVD